jgi:membrane-bound inhibitor of C-type lysozyme
MTIRLVLPCLAIAALAACSREQPAAIPASAPVPAAPEAAASAAAATPAASAATPAVAEASTTAPARTVTYNCGNGRTLEASYAGDKATIVWGGERHVLTIATSGSGARYTGDGLQWWTKGQRDATLSKLGIGELVASDVGIACSATHVKASVSPGKH